MLGCNSRGCAVYRALNSNIIRESPCVWFAFGADAVGGALQAALSAHSAHICICGVRSGEAESKRDTPGIHVGAHNQSHLHGPPKVHVRRLIIHFKRCR